MENNQRLSKSLRLSEWVENLLSQNITIKTVYLALIASSALNLGMSLATFRWKPNAQEISNYVEQGMNLQQHLSTIQGGNEMLNPYYSHSYHRL